MYSDVLDTLDDEGIIDVKTRPISSVRRTEKKTGGSCSFGWMYPRSTALVES